MLAMYIAGVAVMFFLLAGVSLIPNAWIEKNVAQGRAVAQAEDIGRWTPIFSYAPADELDLFTDVTIMETLLQDPSQTVFERAMTGETYAGGTHTVEETRYWQGYKVWLRPAFILFTYVDLRVVMHYILTALALLCVLRLHTRFGAWSAAGFAGSLVLGHFLIVPWLFQYFEVFWIALAAAAFLLKHYETEKTSVGQTARWFLLIGMATQYFDFLTAPPLTLCLPLAIVLAADVQQHTLTLPQRWARFLWPCAAWAFGWLFGWAAKWPLSAWVLHRDVIGDALSEAKYRSALGAAGGRLSALAHAVLRNLFCYLPMSQLRTHGNTVLFLIVQALVLAGLVWMAAKVLRRRPARAQWLAIMPMAAGAALPYLWFIVLAGHTEMHYVFAYRSQIGSAFLLWNAWLYLAGRLGHGGPPAQSGSRHS